MAKAKAGKNLKKKRKVRRVVTHGVVHIQASFNNTLISMTDQDGNMLCWSSSGAQGNRGSKKGTPFGAQMAATVVGEQAKEYGVKYVDVEICGPGAGRESGVRALHALGYEIKSIRDVTPIPHNGCRPPKRRRV